MRNAARNPKIKITVRAQGYTPPPLFCKKRLQAAENKEREVEKEGEEKPRGAKPLKTHPYRHTTETGERHNAGVTRGHRVDTRGIQIDVKGKELREEGFVTI